VGGCLARAERQRTPALAAFGWLGEVEYALATELADWQ
jgi:hypothetical protein